MASMRALPRQWPKIGHSLPLFHEAQTCLGKYRLVCAGLPGARGTESCQVRALREAVSYLRTGSAALHLFWYQERRRAIECQTRGQPVSEFNSLPRQHPWLPPKSLVLGRVPWSHPNLMRFVCCSTVLCHFCTSLRLPAGRTGGCSV